MLYCQAIFPRGAGFGNRLFPWARCRIFSHLTGVPMLGPKWTQLRIGPLLRGGIDRKYYANQILLLGLFRKQNFGGWQRFWIESNSRRKAEPQNFADLAVVNGHDEAEVVTFQGEGNHFRDLVGWEEFLLSELRSIARKRWLDLAAEFADTPIAINVRCGNDFKNAKNQEDYLNKGGIKTPLEWFISSLSTIRTALGYQAKAVVVSDGTGETLRDLLAIDNVHFVRPGCAISDLLILSQAKVLIASGGSSFSAWASFLGQMPTISYPGQSLAWFRLVNKHGHYVGEFDPAAPADAFINSASFALASQ